MPDPTPAQIAKTKQIVQDLFDPHDLHELATVQQESASKDYHRRRAYLLKRMAKALADEAQATREQLMPYLMHRHGCQWLNEDTATHPRKCTCELESALRHEAGRDA